MSELPPTKRVALDVKAAECTTPPEASAQSDRTDSNMKFPDTLGTLRAYHQKATLPTPSTPAIPNDARCKEFMTKLDTELSSFKRCIDSKNLRGIGEALSGMQHALSSAVLECGMGSLFKRLFEEVQRSNMSKACASVAEAEATCTHYRTKKKTACHFRPVGDKFVVYRDADEKVLKSVKYSQVNFVPLLGPYLGKSTKPEATGVAKADPYGVSDCLNNVKAFHELFRAPVLPKPKIPGPQRCELRVNLIAEEARELKDALQAGDLLETADALCDIQYVLSGAVLEFGFGSAFCALFEALHATRMKCLA